MKDRTIRLDLNDLEDILKNNGTIGKDEFLNDVHIEPGEMVLRVLCEEEKASGENPTVHLPLRNSSKNFIVTEKK